MSDKQKQPAEAKAPKQPPLSRDEAGDASVSIATRAAGEVALNVLGRFQVFIAAFLMAFAGVFLLIGWQFGPLVILQHADYAKLTKHVDASIVES